MLRPVAERLALTGSHKQNAREVDARFRRNRLAGCRMYGARPYSQLNGLDRREKGPRLQAFHTGFGSALLEGS